MGSKPLPAAHTAAIPPASSDHDVAGGRFGMPHAVVIVAFVAAAVFMAPHAHNTRDVLGLLAGAGAIGAAVVVLAVVPSRGSGRLARLLRAYFSVGN